MSQAFLDCLPFDFVNVFQVLSCIKCLQRGLFERLFGMENNVRGCMLVFNQLPQSREMFVNVLKMPGLSFF